MMGFKRLLYYLDLNHLGILEVIFALYPILSGYAYGPFRLDLFTLLVMDVIAFKKAKSIVKFKPLLYLLIYVLVHELVLFFFLDDMPVYHLNALFSTAVFLTSIFIIAPALDYNKLLGAFSLIAIMSIAGILYHFIVIRNGGEIHPIKLPFLPNLSDNSRLFALGNRPTSFYWEPAAFITYMMVPLFISLNDHKYVWTFVIILSMFLSTSSTGILLSIVMVGIYILTQKTKKSYKLLLIILSMVLVYFLFESDFFEYGMNKIENTKVEETSRLINGPTLVFNMPIEQLVTGMISANVNDYYRDGIVNAYLLSTNSGAIFVSTFWLILAKFGVFGLFLYLNIYNKIVRENRMLFPYIIILLIALFVQGAMLSSVFVFQMVFILAFLRCKW